MKTAFKITMTFMLFCAMAVLTSCSREESLSYIGNGDSVPVRIRLDLQPEQEGNSDVQTKSVSDTEEPSCIKNLWVVQYNGVSDASVLMGSASYISSLTEDGSVKTELSATSAPSTIFFIANSFDRTMVFPKTLGEMKNLSRLTPSPEWLMGRDGENLHIMFTGWTTEAISPETEIRVTLKRNIARINLKVINSSDGANPKVTIHSVRIRSAASVSYFFPTYSPSETFPPSASLNTVDYESVEWTTPGQGSSSVSQDFCFYVPVNKRGTVDNDKQTDKGKYNPGKATYAVLECTYNQDGEDIPINYSFFLGANLTDDFNIESNKSYNYTLEIKNKGTVAGDARIEDFGTVDYSLPEIERANCYMLNPPLLDEFWRSFIIPVDRVNTFWGKTSSDYENQENNHLGAESQWEAKVIWADFELDNSNFRFRNGTDIFQGSGTEPIVVQIRKGASGNVLIGLRKKSGTQYSAYLWSWHLWITDYSPDDVKKNSVKPVAGVFDYGVTGGNVHHLDGAMWTSGVLKNGFIMDRNLGAFDTDYHPSSVRGTIMYQFGRKDPMYKPAITFQPASGDALTFSISNPANFITTTQGGGWMVGNKYNPDPVPSVSILWQDPTATGTNHKKSIFDPCPPGWKVPEHGVFSDFNTSNFVQGVNMRTYHDTVKFPYSGWWTYQTGGASDGLDGCYWCSNARNDGIFSTLYGWYDSRDVRNNYPGNRAYGFSVRCVTE